MEALARLQGALAAVEARLGLGGAWATALLCFVGTLVVLAAKAWWDARSLKVLEAAPARVGDVTLAELAKFDASDPLKPILVAIRGRVFDVTKGRDFYGRGALPQESCL